MRYLAAAAGVLLGLILAVPGAHQAQAANEWKVMACSASPIVVGGIEGEEQCMKGPVLSQTRNTCVYTQFNASGKDFDGRSYFVYLERKDSGYCYMLEPGTDTLLSVMKQINPPGTGASDFGSTHRLGDTVVVEFKRTIDFCFGFINSGGTGPFGHGVTHIVIGQFCIQKDGGYDDDAKRKLIAGVKVAP
ncbi:MAG TPA: hypothetical protein VHM90_17475 [Phycisphaerae bacterium]|nr:hypothetical protein [Phycisphaerae bacterium]